MFDFELMKCPLCKCEWNQWGTKESPGTAVEYLTRCPNCGCTGYSVAQMMKPEVKNEP